MSLGLELEVEALGFIDLLGGDLEPLEDKTDQLERERERDRDLLRRFP